MTPFSSNVSILICRIKVVIQNALTSKVFVFCMADRKLAEQTRLLKQRNRALLNAAAAVPSASTAGASSSAKGAPSSTTAANPVQLAYIASLEQQLSGLRDEVALLYKNQGQNAQRLLLMSESHREKEEEARRQSEILAKLQLDHEKLKRQADDLGHAVGEKDRGIQILQDELATLSLELSQIEARNQDLKKDNASLLQRWLDRMNEEAGKMNEGTIWLEEVRKRRESSTQPEGKAAAAGTAAASQASSVAKS